MLKRTSEVQSQIEIVTLEELVHEGHLLRKIHKAVDFNFIFDGKPISIIPLSAGGRLLVQSLCLKLCLSA